MTIGRERPPAKKSLKKLLAVTATALLVSLPLAVPAMALPTGPGIRDGKNVTVFHNLDFVAVFGYEVGEQLTVEVFRGDHLIGSAFGPAVEVDEGLPLNGALEVNHGPEGTAVQGDCWTGHTPDILPGDHIVVTDSTGATDEILVDDITMEAPRDYTETADTSDVAVEGRASYADGTAIPVEQLNSGEIRVGSRFRASASEVVRTPGTTDGYTAIYRAPYLDLRNRDNLSPAQQKQAILTGDHAMGYGHVAPLPRETQVLDGLGGGGPAPGCEQAPGQANAVATSDDEAVNLTSDTLNLGGTAMDMVSGVSVTLSDGDAATLDPTVAATDLSAGPGEKTWSVQFSRAQLDALNDGTLTATGSYDLTAGGTTTGANMEIEKDTVAPANVTATPPGGLFNGNQSVTLNGPADADQVRYTLNGSNPSATTGTIYNEQEIQITSNQTIKAIAIDAAGNPSGIASFAYEIDRVVPAIGANLDSGSYNGTQSLRFTSPSPDTKEIRYTDDGSTPTATNGTVYTDPIEVTETTTFRAVAVDNAGNVSAPITRNIGIRSASTTTLGMSTNNLKLGGNRIVQGRVSPDHADGSVRMTIDRPGSLPTMVRTLPLDLDSRYRFFFRPTAVGTYRVNVTFLQDADSLQSSSGTKSFRVVRR
jgi:hypothetical protein